MSHDTEHDYSLSNSTLSLLRIDNGKDFYSSTLTTNNSRFIASFVKYLPTKDDHILEAYLSQQFEQLAILIEGHYRG